MERRAASCLSKLRAEADMHTHTIRWHDETRLAFDTQQTTLRIQPPANPTAQDWN